MNQNDFALIGHSYYYSLAPLSAQGVERIHQMGLPPDQYGIEGVIVPFGALDAVVGGLQEEGFSVRLQ